MSPRPPFYSCACPTGVKLKPNGVTCADGKAPQKQEKINKEILFYKRLPQSASDRHFIIKFDEINGNKKFKEMSLNKEIRFYKRLSRSASDLGIS